MSESHRTHEMGSLFKYIVCIIIEIYFIVKNLLSNDGTSMDGWILTSVENCNPSLFLQKCNLVFS